MKLNKLASAVSVSLAALALTACGSSDDDKPIPNTPTVVDNTAAQDAAKQAAEQAKIAQIKQAAIAEGLNEEQAVTFANANKDKSFDFASDEFKNSVKLFKEQAEKDAANKPVDAGNNTVISKAIENNNPLFAGFDASKLTSVQSGHYVRKEDSNFDRAANPNSKNTANSGTVAHPTLNLQNPYLSNYLVGAEGTGADNVWAVNYVGEYAKNGKKFDAGLDDVENVYDTIGLDAKGNEKEPVASNMPADAKDRDTLQQANKAVAINVKDALVFNAEKSKIEVADIAGESGLVANQASVSRIGQVGKPDTIVGLEEKYNDHKVRIFGKNHDNLHLNAEDVNTSDKIKEVKKGSKAVANSYQAGFDDKGNLVEVTEAKLVNVQYGRLTTNIDRLADDPRDVVDEKTGKRGPLKLIPRPFEAQGTDGSVDIYFYRGTNETTLAEMNKVKAEANGDEKLGGRINYLGHALTYGVSPILTKNDTENTFLPNSFGNGDQVIQTIGNFVEATFDTANSTLKGNIYNFINDNAGGVDKNGKATKFTRQNLIGFEGDVYGNTAIGIANYAGETGNFRGSFFGQGAEELGGNITSVSNSNGYGEGKWGAVFGAERVTPEAAKEKGINFDLNTTGIGTNVDP